MYVYMYVCIDNDLEKLLPCEQISHPCTSESPRDLSEISRGGEGGENRGRVTKGEEGEGS